VSLKNECVRWALGAQTTWEGARRGRALATMLDNIEAMSLPPSQSVSSTVELGAPGETIFVRGRIWRRYWDDGRHSKKLREGKS